MAWPITVVVHNRSVNLHHYEVMDDEIVVSARTLSSFYEQVEYSYVLYLLVGEEECGENTYTITDIDGRWPVLYNIIHEKAEIY